MEKTCRRVKRGKPESRNTRTQKLSSVGRPIEEKAGEDSLPNRIFRDDKELTCRFFFSFFFSCVWKRKGRNENVCAQKQKKRKRKESLVSGRRRRQHSWPSARTFTRERHVYLVVPSWMASSRTTQDRHWDDFWSSTWWSRAINRN